MSAIGIPMERWKKALLDLQAFLDDLDEFRATQAEIEALNKRVLDSRNHLRSQMEGQSDEVARTLPRLP